MSDNVIDNQPQPVPGVPAAQPEAQNEGLLKRVDELTARFRDADERAARAEQAAEAARRQAQDVMGLLMERPAPQMQGPAEPVPEIDPDDARKLQHFINPYAQQIKQMEQNYQQLSQNMKLSQVQMLAPSYTDNPAIVKRAHELAQSWSRIPNMPWAPEDAFKFAIGELGFQEQAKQRSANFSRQGFGIGAGNVMSSQMAPPTAPASPRSTRPANFDQLDAETQLAILDREGVGDQPL